MTTNQAAAPTHQPPTIYPNVTVRLRTAPDMGQIEDLRAALLGRPVIEPPIELAQRRNKAS